MTSLKPRAIQLICHGTRSCTLQLAPGFTAEIALQVYEGVVQVIRPLLDLVRIDQEKSFHFVLRRGGEKVREWFREVGTAERQNHCASGAVIVGAETYSTATSSVDSSVKS